MEKTKLIHEIRAIKGRGELANIIRAQRISEKVLRDVLKFLKDGVSEIETANFIKKSFVKYLSAQAGGAPILSFSPIVAFGKNTADVHHEPNKTKLKKPATPAGRPARRGGGDMIMLDFGCAVGRYCSDMTRTYFWGEPSRKQERIYFDVLKAQELAINAIKRGERRGWIIDKIARNFLNKKYGAKKFSHGLGHGVGVVIHEWPSFKPKSKDIIPAGCVMTVEPGIYFKGFGGVRIEDMILITKNGCKNLTKVSKDLKSIILKTL